MIISHKFKFIFVKTRKTAGTSIEAYLSKFCGSGDVLTPVYPVLQDHVARNYRGCWNIVTELSGLSETRNKSLAFRQWLKGRRYYNHMPASMIRARCSNKVWNTYLKFTVDRDPFEKVMSQYSRRLADFGESYDLATYFAESRLPLNIPLYTDFDGNPLVDRVLRYEELDSELGRLFSELDVPWGGSLKVRAKSGFRPLDRIPAREALPEIYKSHIREIFDREFELNGYPKR